MLSLDVTLTACRRPQLLAQTLDSFSRHLFSKVEIQTIYLNIDPIWGETADDSVIESLCRQHAPNVVARRPDKPSFGAAVKWLWSQPQTDWFLHIEDDWLVNRAFNLARFAKLADGHVGQIRLYDANHPLRRPFKRRKAAFATSPSLTRRDFGRIAAQCMDPALDPEKQYSRRINTEGVAQLKSFPIRFYSPRYFPPFVTDIGREWRANRGIEKQVIAGSSVWSAGSPAAS